MSFGAGEDGPVEFSLVRKNGPLGPIREVQLLIRTISH